MEPGTAFNSRNLRSAITFARESVRHPRHDLPPPILPPVPCSRLECVRGMCEAIISEPVVCYATAELLARYDLVGRIHFSDLRLFCRTRAVPRACQTRVVSEPRALGKHSVRAQWRSNRASEQGRKGARAWPTHNGEMQRADKQAASRLKAVWLSLACLARADTSEMYPMQSTLESGGLEQFVAGLTFMVYCAARRQETRMRAERQFAMRTKSADE